MNGDGKNVKSVVKAAAIINLLASSDEPLSLSFMGAQLNMAKSTLHGLVSTLVDVGYVEQDAETGKYLLGFKLFEIGSTISRKWNERKIAYPFMQKLAEQTGETIHLAVLDDGEVLYINKQESSGSIRIVTDTGVKMPVYCTGVGKVLLSGLSTLDFNKIMRKQKLIKYTDNTITDPEELKEELEKIRDRGYATDNQEYMEGLRCVAVPIFNHRGRITCAMSIAGPISRMRGQEFDYKKAHLLEAAHEISKQMGYSMAHS